MKFILNLLSLLLFTASLCSTYSRPLCHDNERIALLQFKLSFSINKSASSYPYAYPKTEFWKSTGNRSDCCSWVGIKCDKESGHVTTLDLSSSYLYGFITSNSTIFELIHLQTLNLAGNHFRYSIIPSEIGRLSNLRHLNFSMSVLFGEVPLEIFNLQELISLDLSNNALRMRGPNFKALSQSLIALEMIYLTGVNISSPIPEIFANLSSLTHIALEDCGLHDTFPKGIFFLPNLQLLNVGGNKNLVGNLPEFHNDSKLEKLLLGSTGFSGNVPASIGNLGLLTELDFSGSSFTGSVPYSLGKLTKLTIIDFSYNDFEGQIPNSLANLTQLEHLSIASCHLTGEIPSAIANLTKLTVLRLYRNMLQGLIPSSISQLENLNVLSLWGNNFASPLEFNLFFKLKQLQVLLLSDVDLIFPKAKHDNHSDPQLVSLGLKGCNLTQFPDFLHNQTRLGALTLSYNLIQGPLPIPSPPLSFYDLSHNALSGEIPTSICNATSLAAMDLEDNKLSGRIPPCLFKLSKTLSVLSLAQNNLQGTILDAFTSKCTLGVVNLRGNWLQGKVPRSITNCSSLKVLNLGYNLINDTFPSWLVALPALQALALGSNSLHGALPLELESGFPNLHFLDLSDNKLTGTLPFLNLHAMVAESDESQSSDVVLHTARTISGLIVQYTYCYSIETMYKGRKTSMELNIFTSLDFSNNKFVGKIPDSIVNLVGLQALNLSHNHLTGSIPQSLGDLSKLEVLDLSCNLLSREIPQQLKNLTFLVIFNVSYNHLTGPIPEGNQFNTFENDSFEGNLGLCGSPLLMKCGNSKVQSSPQQQSHCHDGEDEESLTLVDWIIISMGYISGVVVGVILGRIFTDQKHEWFIETFGRRPHHNRRRA
ncbi:hypothetical protein Ancab_040635 [Ancistrocladus abbreviatus]